MLCSMFRKLKMKASTSLCIKIFLVIYAGIITSFGLLSATAVAVFDTFFASLSFTSSICYIFYLNTRSIIELTLLDRNELLLVYIDLNYFNILKLYIYTTLVI